MTPELGSWRQADPKLKAKLGLQGTLSHKTTNWTNSFHQWQLSSFRGFGFVQA